MPELILRKDNRGNLIEGSHDSKKLRYELYIGIDPDIHESGFAVWDKKARKLTACCTKSFFDLYETLRPYFRKTELKVIIEGGWLLDKSNWHEKKFIGNVDAAVSAFSKGFRHQSEKAVQENVDRLKGLVNSKTIGAGQRIAKNVGENHSVGKLIVEMCVHLEIPFNVVPPKKPIFASEPIFKKATGWPGRTNKDARSAANYVFGY